jgi:hypothetical protein
LSKTIPRPHLFTSCPTDLDLSLSLPQFLARQRSNASTMDPHPTPLTDRGFRVIMAIGFFPALGMLLPYSIICDNIVPAFGLIPMSLSSLVSAIALTRLNVIPRWLDFWVDAFLALSLFGLLLPSWLTLGNYGWQGSSLVVLGAYGTTPLTVNLYITFHSAFCLSVAGVSGLTYVVVPSTPGTSSASSLSSSDRCTPARTAITNSTLAGTTASASQATATAFPSRLVGQVIPLAAKRSISHLRTSTTMI